MRVTPVFSWIILILEPLGPMTMPILFSGTLIWAVCMLVFSACSASTAARASAPFWAALAMNAAISSLDAALGTAMPGTVFVGAIIPGIFCFFAWAAMIACSFLTCSCFSFLFSAFFERPVLCSQSPPVPSSISNGWVNSTRSFSGAFSSFGAAFALAACLAAGFAAAAFAGAGAAGAGSAFALALPLAFGSGAGGVGGGASFLLPAFAFASALGAALPLAAGSGAGAALGAALPFAAAAFGSALGGSSFFADAFGFAAAAFGASLAFAFGSGAGAAFAFGFFSGTGSGAGGGAASAT
mmetsp:Transcript_14115/g.26417  ORF Transcript_14115/g.26417 Transcript_14115/m.26417 type:complete len:298 (-) Transcript_14115:170-1063(-)